MLDKARRPCRRCHAPWYYEMYDFLGNDLFVDCLMQERLHGQPCTVLQLYNNKKARDAERALAEQGGQRGQQ